MATLVPDRRNFTNVQQWRVGVSSAAYSYVDEASGLGPIEWEEVDPWVTLTIPGADDAVYQLVGNPDGAGWLDVYDYEAITVLLYETAIDGSANYAVTATSRNAIGYFAVVVGNTRIVNATDTRTETTSTFVFNDTRIRHIEKRFRFPVDQSVWRVHFYADSVTQTDT
jgi:hypothetical protein